MHFQSYRLYLATESSSQHYPVTSVANLSIVLSIPKSLLEVSVADYSIEVAARAAGYRKSLR